MSYQGGSHKPPYHVERRFVHTGGTREGRFEPGSRVVVRSEPGVPNPYEGRMGEIVGSEAPGGETVYSVLLDFALPGEEPGVPVPVLASELMQTHLPKPENITVSNAPRPNRRLHAEEGYLIGGIRERE
jgi:hypothetical protein